MEEHKVVIAAASRPYPGEEVNGDAWAFEHSNGLYRVTLVDGLGHGAPAHEAARIARHTLLSNPDLPPDQALKSCHHALAGSRGAVALVAQIDPRASRLTYAGIGNVEARLWQVEREQRLISYRGILGSNVPKYRCLELDLGPDWLLVLHTDGVSARFHLGSMSEFKNRSLSALAGTIVREWGRQTDDATVLVVQPNPGQRPAP